MTELDRAKIGLGKKSEATVRGELLELSSAFADKAERATNSADARNYAEASAALFSAARIRTIGDPTPDPG